MAQSLTPTADLPAMVEGDDRHEPIAFDTSDGNPIDITGWTVSFTVAERNGGSTLIEKDITTHDDPTNGKTSFDLTPSDTSGLAGTKRYDIQRKDSSGDIRTVVLGTITFLDGVTDRTV